MSKVNNIVKVPTSVTTTFFRYWLEFLGPFHNLTDKEIEVVVELLKERYELSRFITENKILDQVTLSDTTKEKIRERCKMSTPYFQVLVGKLRKKGIIKGESINPKFIPNLHRDDTGFQLLIYFDFGVKDEKTV